MKSLVLATVLVTATTSAALAHAAGEEPYMPRLAEEDAFATPLMYLLRSAPSINAESAPIRVSIPRQSMKAKIKHPPLPRKDPRKP